MLPAAADRSLLVWPLDSWTVRAARPSVQIRWSTRLTFRQVLTRSSAARADQGWAGEPVQQRFDAVFRSPLVKERALRILLTIVLQSPQ
jgi:hypothetical protein